MSRPDAGDADHAEAGNWRAGVAARLDEIRRELEALQAQIEAQLADLTDRAADRAGHWIQ
jgi:hypothetical protein